MEGEDDAVADEPHVERCTLLRAQTQDAERQGRDRGPTQDDGDRRQREPLAEKARKAEERGRDVERHQRTGMRHALRRRHVIIDPDCAISRRTIRSGA